MKVQIVKRSNAISASCSSGHGFVRKMFKTYGSDDGKTMVLSLGLLKGMVEKFRTYLDKTRIHDMEYTALTVHLRCFFDNLLETVQRKSQLQIGTSDDWADRQYGSVNDITCAFWKELQRVAK